MKRQFYVSALAVCLPWVTLAKSPAPEFEMVEPTETVSASGGDSPLQAHYWHQPGADLDDGGELSLDSAAVNLGLPLLRDETRFAAVTLRYQWADYDFDSSTPGSFGALDPWEEVHRWRLSLPVFWDLSDRWSLFVMPQVHLSYEDGASPSDALTAGGFLGGVYQWSDTLAIGPGIGFQTRLEDNASVFPILYVDWQFAERWNLTTRPAGGPVGGPGVTVTHQLSPAWSLRFGAHYDEHRFRLDSGNAAAAEGVGEYSGVPLYAALAWQPGDYLRFNVFAGVRLAPELRLEDDDGHTLAKDEGDAAPFFGAGFSLHF